MLVAVLFSCRSEETQLSVTITKIVVTDAVPSGSGIAYYNDSVILIGDDAEFYGNVSVLNDQYTKKALYPDAIYNRIEKRIKHDLESATFGDIRNERFLFAFGSGGISPYRDTMFAIHMQDQAKSFKASLLPIYNAIKKTAGLGKQELNIEGAAITGDRLLLFNRGNNLVILFPWQSFTEYIQKQDSAPVPNFKIVKFSLPVVNNFPIGVSGACTLSNNEILFTASLEETKDFIQDGTIKGSYIGLLDLNASEEIKLISLTPLKDASGKILTDKLESIEVIKKDGKKTDVVAVADNDDGKSKLFYITLKVP